MSTIGWDSGQIYGSNLNSSRSRVDSLEELEDKFSDFVENYRVGAEFIYRYKLAISVSYVDENRAELKHA